MNRDHFFRLFDLVGNEIFHDNNSGLTSHTISTLSPMSSGRASSESESIVTTSGNITTGTPALIISRLTTGALALVDLNSIPSCCPERSGAIPSSSMTKRSSSSEFRYQYGRRFLLLRVKTEKYQKTLELIIINKQVETPSLSRSFPTLSHGTFSLRNLPIIISIISWPSGMGSSTNSPPTGIRTRYHRPTPPTLTQITFDELQTNGINE